MTNLPVMACTLLLSVSLANTSVETLADECRKSYVVARASTVPRIDGVLEVGEWPAGCWETSMGFPWRTGPSPDTAFCALADDEGLSFAFRVEDPDVVLVEEPGEEESVVALGDRVELFFARDPRLEQYYSIEIDPLGRVLDYTGRFYRRFGEEWDCPDLERASRRRPGGYDVEARISADGLRSMGLDPVVGASLRVGVFRGEFSSRDGRPPDEGWISWVRPVVEQPDFHVPSAFGCFRLSATE